MDEIHTTGTLNTYVLVGATQSLPTAFFDAIALAYFFVRLRPQ